MKKFITKDREPKEFWIDDEQYFAAARLPAGIAQQFVAMSRAEPADQVEMLGNLLDTFLLHESAERFAKRLSDPDNPVDFETILGPDGIVAWLMSEYGMGRPTEPSSNSSPLPNSTGTSSTDGAPPETSTPSPSTLAVTAI